MKRNTYKKRIKRQVLLTLFAGMTAFSGAITGYGASGVVPNNELPQGGQSLWKNHTGLNQNVGSESKPVMNIHQQGKNGVISWNSFNIGANGTVNFSSDTQGFNTLNYVNSGNASQLYGKLTGLGGNLYIVNPAGVQIGPSAQINVGSLHVAAKYLNLDAVSKNPTDVESIVKGGTLTSAQLMSLGNISANKVTFEGNGRIVIDTEKLENLNREKNENFEVLTNDADHVVLGYDAYDKEKGYAQYDEGPAKTFGQVSVSGKKTDDVTGYMWVEDASQLQAIDTNLSGKYALKNSIDAIGTKDWNGGKGFNPLGARAEDGFTGTFDALDFHIFDLTINRSGMDNVGLFSKTKGATLNNVTLVGGKITGKNNVGTLVGKAVDTTITGAVNSAAVVGTTNVGGLVGTGTGVTLKDAINMGDITGTKQAVGGLAGNLTKGTIQGKSYNIGNVGGPDDTNQPYDVGGLVGVATDSALGNEKAKDGIIYNGLTVEGKYNVGGIAGRLEKSTLQNAENRSAIKATGFTTESYVYQGAGYSSTNPPKVQASNVGGLVGISTGNTFTNVTNLGDVSSAMGKGNDYYDGGNVGGIVGRAEGTNITTATNQETKVTGAHNVGGIAGYFGGKGTIISAVNDGAEIMATGGRTSSDFATELVRPKAEEKVHFGNMGGIVGYLYGNGAYVTKSTNSGNVHSQLIADNATTISESSLAANTGGIVGKINRTTTLTKEDILNGKQAAVSDSYNSGTVQGFIGIGGVVGQMYNGEVVRSYNLGDIRTTKTVASLDPNKLPTANMGGVVGDTTEDTPESVSALIYDVYNKGKIGDETFTYAARHVGGVVGRLRGTLEKAYNSGDVYNGYNVVGGVVGWYHRGNIKDVFNTGNVTVKNQDKLTSGNPSRTSSVGGIIGAATPGTGLAIENAYNIGTIRSYQVKGGGKNAVGGIAGRGVNLNNVYTLGTVVAYDADGKKTEVGVGRLVGEALEGNEGTYNRTKITNGYYIETGNSEFTYTDSELSSYGRKGTVIQWKDRFNPRSYQEFTFSNYGANGKKQDNANGSWRMYGNTLPMLNAFLPDTEAYFRENKPRENKPTDSKGNALSSVQYGTEYDPNLTIIKTENALSFDWNDLGLGGDSRIAVYGGGLTLTNVNTMSKTAYFNGNIYSTGDLVLHGKDGKDMLFGAGADLHGSSVTISAKGVFSLNGNIVATGENGASDISITAGDVKSYGKIISAQKDGKTTVPGIAEKRNDDASYGDVRDMNQAVTETGIRYSKTVTSKGTGNVTIMANGNDVSDGSVTLGYGIQGKGLVRTGGSLSVKGTGDVYVESDLSIGKDIALKSTGDASEVVLDVTNIGLDAKPQNQAEGLKDFMNHFNKDNTGEGKITLETASGDAKFAVDLWDDAKGEYTFNKFGSAGEANESAIKNAFNSMDATVKIGDQSYDVFKSRNDQTNGFMYVWVDGADQLQGIQNFVNNDSDAAYYNYALKSDIDASVLKKYKAIGGDTVYQGNFDGRGHAIIGLTAGGSEAANTGVFSAVGEQGAVKNLSVLAGNFTGKDNVGAVAGVNKGTISDITTYGNTVTSDGHAGGLVGTNEKIIKDSTSVSNVIANSQEAMAGGIAGINAKGAVIDNSESNSAVAGSKATSSGLGGVAGVNKGTLSKVDNLGVTNGGDSGSSAVGGIAGINTGSIENAYNESFVTGGEKTGGLVGINEKSGSLVNAANAGRVEGKGAAQDAAQDAAQEIGGLVGDNDGSILNGRNGGNVTGTTYVGGIVGTNGKDSTLTDIINDTSILIKGSTYVGGIAGQNAGRIEDTEASRTLSDGVVEGVEYVGGIAGKNTGYIENPHNNISLRINEDDLKDGETAQYFGGVAGINEQEGTIGNATNLADVTAKGANKGANYVGGIVGYNKGTLLNLAGNRGNVVGDNYVGGVAGINEHSLSDVDASNTGSVQARQGGAGGIFAVNHGDVTNSRLVNDAVVAGGANAGATGGIFAENTANIGKTTLINGMNASVIGLKNVGGLVGENSGAISGGRDASDGYYKDQVYNNGVIEAGTWHDKNGNHQMDAGEVTEGAGENIGGLVGKNTGSVTAAYNTGAIKAKESTNVGGIAGTNAGKIDQVFSSIFTQDGNEGQVEGKTAVGGLIGLNTEKGIVTDAYTTSKALNGGSIAGVNQGLLKNVYSVTGKDESIAATNTGRIENGYALDRGSDASLAEDTYGGFTFGSKWKIYEGYSSPLLKVFLTKATYDAMTGELVWAADGFAADHGSGQGLIHQGLGTGSNYFWSQQLAFAGGHPNWLGYDLDPQYEKPSGNYDFLFDDAPFGKREPNRERKAEISFERGGMEV